VGTPGIPIEVVFVRACMYIYMSDQNLNYRIFICVVGKEKKRERKEKLRYTVIDHKVHSNMLILNL